MNINVKLFAFARDIYGDDAVELELPERADIGQLRKSLASTNSGLGPFNATTAIRRKLGLRLGQDSTFQGG